MKLKKSLDAKEIAQLAGWLELFRRGRVLEGDFIEALRGMLSDEPAPPVGWNWEKCKGHPYYAAVKKWFDDRMAFERARREDHREQ